MSSWPDTVRLTLADGAGLTETEPGTIGVRRGVRRIRVKDLEPGTEAALRRLADGPVSAAELARTVTQADADLARLTDEIGWLTARCLVQYSCVVSGVVLMETTARGALARFSFDPPSASLRARLSRFAYLHRIGDVTVVDSPASHARVTLHAPVLGGMLTALAQPWSVAGLVREMPGCEPGLIEAAFGFLLGSGVIAPVDHAGEIAAETEPGPAQRDFHDVVLHAASRRGLTSEPIGGTYRFRGSLPPAPAVRPRPDGGTVELPRPDLDRLMAEDMPLARVMECRRSIREQGPEPLTLTQLGEFLYRVARVREVRGADVEKGRPYEVSSRPYPSGGAAYDLELYLTVGSCTGLVPAMYHYDPQGHLLTGVCRQPELIRSMLLEAYFASGRRCHPQVLITLAARFARTSWKYQGMAYALTLKNAGVLYDAMYLAATVMDLAPCGVGCGDSATFSVATGLDPLVESSVGEFMLGTRA